MQWFWDHKIVQLFLLKAKYATTSLIATLVEYGVYTALVFTVLTPRPSHVISYACGMVFNFVLQRFFVFDLQRTVRTAFMLAMVVSMGALTLSTLLFIGLSGIPFFAQNHYLAKIGATTIVFFYNFYLKRYVFEKRFI